MPSNKFYFLQGEETVNSLPIVHGTLILTNYRLLFLSNPSSTTAWSIPIWLLWKAEIVELVHVRVTTKLGTSVLWTFPDELGCDTGFSLIVSLLDASKDNESSFACKFRTALEEHIPDHPFLLSASELLQINDVGRSVGPALVGHELNRMKFNNCWKITDINEKFKICSSYPEYHIVPRDITDTDIKKMAGFRSHNRFTSVVWRSQTTGAVLLRCAQPCVGIMFYRNEYDEKFLRAVLSSCRKNPGEITISDSPRLLIVDARNYSSAQLNRFRGGGFEYSDYYDQAQISFMDLPNLHTVRDSFERLSQLFATKPEIHWFSMLERSSWLNYIGQLLKAATEIACALELHGRPVMVHCTDGWDRTPQLSSLAQILADPYYRTVQGFRLLVEREWLLFGHKFGDRCGHSTASNNTDERSPIFLQWLDCVYQIHRQYQHCFEFNESFLLKLGVHVYSSLFGTFLCNSERERQNAMISSRTCSLWGLLSAEYNWTIINHFYEPQVERLLKPDWRIRCLRVWTNLYETALFPTSSSSLTSAYKYSSVKSVNGLAKSVVDAEASKLQVLSLGSNGLSCPGPNSSSSTELPKLDVNAANAVSHSGPQSTGLNDLTVRDLCDPTMDLSSTTMTTASATNPFLDVLSPLRNTRRRSLDGSFSNTNTADPSTDFAASFLAQFHKERESSSQSNLQQHRPAILPLSSVSDDRDIRQVVDDHERDHHDHKSNLLMNSCTFASNEPNPDELDEATDVFTVDEQLDSTGEFQPLSSQSHNGTKAQPSILTTFCNWDDDEYVTKSDNRLHPLLQSNASNQLLSQQSSPIAILSRQNHPTPPDHSQLSFRQESPSSHRGSTSQFHEAVDSPHWSVTTPESNASLCVLSDCRTTASPIGQLKTYPVHATLTEEAIQIGERLDENHTRDYTMHSLPENEILINESLSLSFTSNNSQSGILDHELSFATPVGDACTSAPDCNPTTTSTTISHHSNSQNGSTDDRLIESNLNHKSEFFTRDQTVTSGFTSSGDDLDDSKYKTIMDSMDPNLFELILVEPKGLNLWRDRYFKEVYYPVPSVDQNLDCSDSYSAPRNNLTDESQSRKESIQSELSNHSNLYLSDESFMAENHSLLIESNQPTSLYDLEKQSKPSDIVKGTEVRQNSDQWSNSNELTYKHDSDNVFKSNLTDDLIPNAHILPDWDGLPSLVDRITVRMHVKHQQDQCETQRIQSLHTRIEQKDAEISRLTLELQRLLKHLSSTTYSNRKNSNPSGGGATKSAEQLIYPDCGLDAIEFTSNSTNGECVNNIGDLQEMTHPFQPFDSITSRFNSTVDHENISTMNGAKRLSDSNSFELVAWQPESTAHQCTRCCLEFSDSRPKYHCRRCGYVFCEVCSNDWISYPDRISNQPDRLCKQCYTEISTPNSQLSTESVITSHIQNQHQFPAPTSLLLKLLPSLSPSQSVRRSMPSTLSSSNNYYPAENSVSHSKYSNSNSTSNFLLMSNPNNRPSALVSRNPPSQCRSAGAGTARHPSSSAASDGIAQA